MHVELKRCVINLGKGEWAPVSKFRGARMRRWVLQPGQIL